MRGPDCYKTKSPRGGLPGFDAYQPNSNLPTHAVGIFLTRFVRQFFGLERFRQNDQFKAFVFEEQPSNRSFHTRFYCDVADALLACSNGLSPKRRMHSSHNTMPDESAVSGSVLYPQERCSKRSREIGSGSWFGTTKYNVTGTPRAPQPWMHILVASNGANCCRLMLCCNQKSCQKEKCPAVVKKSKTVRSRT